MKDRMKTLSLSLILTLLLQACSNSSGDVTELEGSWERICFPGPMLQSGDFSTLPFPPPGTVSGTRRTAISFNGNTADFILNTYSDDNCTTLVGSTPLAETSLVDPSTLGIRFEIGNIITTSNGVTVKELNFYNADDQLIPDIYLLQNGASTLYLGKKCYPDSSGLLICTNDRPTEIHYDFYYTRQH